LASSNPSGDLKRLHGLDNSNTNKEADLISHLDCLELLTPSGELVCVPTPLAHANTVGWIDVRRKREKEIHIRQISPCQYS
jgi:hypothetical protein